MKADTCCGTLVNRDASRDNQGELILDLVWVLPAVSGVLLRAGRFEVNWSGKLHGLIMLWTDFI
jgi:hypothetical protein